MHPAVTAALLAGLALCPSATTDGELRVVTYLATPCLPAAHARVTIEPPGLSIVADSLGVATFPGLLPGTYEISVSHAGSVRVVRRLQVEAHAQETILFVDLASAPPRSRTDPSLETRRPGRYPNRAIQFDAMGVQPSAHVVIAPPGRLVSPSAAQ